MRLYVLGSDSKESYRSFCEYFYSKRKPEFCLNSCIQSPQQDFAAKKRASFKQDVSFIIYNEYKCITYNIEHKDNY